MVALALGWHNGFPGNNRDGLAPLPRLSLPKNGFCLFEFGLKPTPGGWLARLSVPSQTLVPAVSIAS